nr:hypothetical protein [Serratia marcescens]
MNDKTSNENGLKKFQIMDKREVKLITKEQYEEMLERGEVFEEDIPTKKEVD